MSEEKTKPIVVKEGAKPCGCYITEYSDDTASIKYCHACALMEAASALNGAARAMASASTALQENQILVNQIALQAAAERSANRNHPGRIIEP